MQEIKKIDKVSLAKITALIYGLIGFIITVLIAVSTMINIIMQQDFAGSVLMVTLFNSGAGLLLGVLSALLAAAMGFIIGFIAAAIYNIFAKKGGGIKVELAEVAEKKLNVSQIDDNKYNA